MCRKYTHRHNNLTDYKSMEILRTVDELKTAAANAVAQGKSIGLVPTMGALHAGHLSLVERARRENDVVFVSIFVNPTQCNNPEDLKTYPRTEEADCAKISDAGVDFAFIPSVEEIYPEEDTRVFDLGEVAAVMEGPMRPGHFNGVAQIVSRLFEWARPTRAYFGEKDFQQIAVIRRMVEIEGGFNGLEIVDCPIVREEDGLALSSRNVRLSADARMAAPLIHKILAKSVDFAKDHSVADTIRFVTEELDSHPLIKVEYYSIVNPLTMQPLQSWGDCKMAPQGCITAYCGDVRLIDNIKYNH